MITLSLLAGLIAAEPVRAQDASAIRDSAWDPVIADGERMLFIGNSYMANEGGVFNYLQKALQQHDDFSIEVDKHIYYGQPLRRMLTDDVRSSIASDRFDTVVFTSERLETMKEFEELVRGSGKKSVVFVTWEGRHPGHNATEEEYTEATRRTVQAMRQMEKETGATTVPVAVAYHDLTLRPPMDVPRVDYLWMADNIHQNELGTLVNMWMLYAILTGKSPVGIDIDMPPHIEGETLQDDSQVRATPEMRKALQERVWKIAQQWKAGETHLD